MGSVVKVSIGVVVGVILVLLIICFCCFVTFGFFSAAFQAGFEQNLTSMNYKFVEGNELSKNKVVIVGIKGPILTEKSGGVFDFLGGVQLVYGREVEKTFDSISKDEDVKAVILDIDSPGGTINGSKIILDAIKEFKEKTGKKVYAFINEVGGSGGYLVAIGADKIYADMGSTIGSIGVITGENRFYDKVLSDGTIVTENGIYIDIIHKGEGKDMGNPFRKMTEKEKNILLTSAENIYEYFVSEVSKSRGISPEEIKSKIGAYVYDAIVAKQYKLIDEIANLDTLKSNLIKDLNLGDDYGIYVIEKGGSFFDYFSSMYYMLLNNKKENNSLFSEECIETKQILMIYGSPSQLCVR
ncbi:MAG: S49 family peptidase [Candidatus Dojkabacteria bacterium]|nr:S49 family peptidase [Candidatus Dojkabacteria bacterium]